MKNILLLVVAWSSLASGGLVFADEAGSVEFLG